MAVAISVQETTVTLTKDGKGIVVQLLVSDKEREPPPGEVAAMRVALTATIPRPKDQSLLWVQVQALTAVRMSIQETIDRLLAERQS
jgi:hypothetical protein